MMLHHWFAHPLGLWLLALIPALGMAGIFSLRKRGRAFLLFGTPQSLERLKTVHQEQRWLRFICLVASITFLVLGIAGPQWGRDREQVLMPGRDLVVLLDMSRSMLAEDVVGKTSSNRLGRAKEALLDLVNWMERRGGHRLALVVFASRPSVICPLTHDYDHFREALARLDPADPLLKIGPGPGGSPSGTRMGKGLRRAVMHEEDEEDDEEKPGLRKAVGVHDRNFPGYQDILMISDGDDPVRDEEWRIGIEAAWNKKIPVHTVGVGDPDKASPIPLPGGKYLHHQGQLILTRLEEQPLEEIARETRGVYIPARTRDLPLGELFRERIDLPAGRESREDIVPVYSQRYPWFFSLALALVVAQMAWGERGRRPTPEKTGN